MTSQYDGLVARAQLRVGGSLRGKYVLERLIGVGGMAAVFEATHRNGSHVAVKLLHPELSSVPEVRKRFQREGYIANRISHPGVVRIIDDDTDDDGSSFIVMELLSGVTIEQEWQAHGRRFSPQRAATIIERLLDVLDAAHAAGVVHRDIKPDNVFLTRDGALKVLDFGIARLADSSSVTANGQMLGTPEYMSPEQAGGRVGEVDPRSDIFSVGAMLFTLLSGQHPHVARTPTEYTVYAATRPGRRLQDVLEGVDAQLAHVVDRALAFERDQRWASAREMQIALRNAVGALGKTVPTTASSLDEALNWREREEHVPLVPEEPHAAGTRTLPLGSMSGPTTAIPIPLNRPKKD